MRMLPFVARLAISLACAALISLQGGRMAHAACGVALAPCSLQADWHTSGLIVYHYDVDGINLIPVEPDDSDTWDITAVHSTRFIFADQCSCRDYTTTVSAVVQWTGSAWSVSCTG